MRANIYFIYFFLNLGHEVSIFFRCRWNFASSFFNASWMYVQSFRIIDHTEPEKFIIE